MWLLSHHTCTLAGARFFVFFFLIFFIFFFLLFLFFFFFQAEDGIRDLVRSRGLGDVYKRQEIYPYITEGIGEDILPKNVDFSLIDHFEKVSDKDAALAARKLAREEGILLSLIHI